MKSFLTFLSLLAMTFAAPEVLRGHGGGGHHSTGGSGGGGKSGKAVEGTTYTYTPSSAAYYVYVAGNSDYSYSTSYTLASTTDYKVGDSLQTGLAEEIQVAPAQELSSFTIAMCMVAMNIAAVYLVTKYRSVSRKEDHFVRAGEFATV